jgi:hypothetical protein
MNASPPVLLHICKETRELARRRYATLFTSEDRIGPYFNLNIDTLYLKVDPDESVLMDQYGGFAKYGDFTRIKRLAIDMHTNEEFFTLFIVPFLLDETKAAGKLEEMVVICPQAEHVSQDIRWPRPTYTVDGTRYGIE